MFRVSLVCCGLLALTGFARAAPAMRVVPDLRYVTGGTDQQRLDLYLPPPNGRAVPLIVWVHGGDWAMSNRRHWIGAPFLAARGYALADTLGLLAQEDVPAFLVGRGYAVASLDYRFSNQALFPAQIEDCKAAVRWLRVHAPEYGIDPAHIGATGESAGGHLVALLGTTGDTRRFDIGRNLDQSSAVQCVVDFYGPTDFLHWGDPPAPTSCDTVHTPVARLLGGTVSTHQEAARSASPVTFVDRRSAPFLIFHGDKDPFVPLQQSQEFAAALHAAGVESTLKIVPGAGHGGREFVQRDNVRLITAFLDHHLKMAARRR